MTKSEAIEKVNGILAEAIPSQLVSSIVKNSNKQFTISEIISIVWNSQLGIQKSIEYFQRLHKKTLLKPYGLDVEESMSILNRVMRALDIIDIETDKCIDERKVLLVNILNEQHNWDDPDVLCLKGLRALKRMIQNGELGTEYELHGASIIELEHSKKHIELSLSNSGEIIDFSYTKEYGSNNDIPDELSNYIDIQTGLKIGDTIKLIDFDMEYVVCSDDNIEYKQGMDIMDASVMVIPKDIIDKQPDETYADIINRILENRQHMDEYEFPFADIITIHHEHLPKLFIERV